MTRVLLAPGEFRGTLAAAEVAPGLRRAVLAVAWARLARQFRPQRGRP